MQLTAGLLAMSFGVALAAASVGGANAFTISEFVAVQQKGVCTGTAAPPCPADQLFVPPVANYNGWSGLQDGSTSCTFVEGDLCRFALVDYAGIADKFLQRRGSHGLGTWFEGTVRQRALDKSRIEVEVKLITHRALIWISELSSYDVFTGYQSIFRTSPLLFGARPTDVLRGRPPALAESVLEVRYVARRGDPIPNLITMTQATPISSTFVSFQARAVGQLGPAYPSPPKHRFGLATIAQLAPDGRNYAVQRVALQPFCAGKDAYRGTAPAVC